MKKGCRDCKHKVDIKFYRVRCNYYLRYNNKIKESPLHKSGIPPFAIESGSFNFPTSFDPSWVGYNCNGHEL